MTAQRAMKASLKRRLVLQIELVEHAPAELADQPARVE